MQSFRSILSQEQFKKSIKRFAKTTQVELNKNLKYKNEKAKLKNIYIYRLIILTKYNEFEK